MVTAITSEFLTAAVYIESREWS